MTSVSKPAFFRYSANKSSIFFVAPGVCLWYNSDMENSIYNIEFTSLTYGRGYVYSLRYHIVWCTKYRKQILQNGVDTDLKEMLQQLAEEYQFRILAMEVKILKGNTARWLFLKRPELKRSLWGGHLWNPSYCAVTVSDRSREQVTHYIESQKEKG